MTDVINQNRSDLSEQTIAALVKRAGEEVSLLVRDELRLAQIEVAEKGKRAGVGAGLLGGAGFLSLYGLAALVATAILALALVIPAWSAALIVAVVLFAIAGILALRGRKQLRRATPPVPVTAVHSVRADMSAVADAIKDAREHR
jgi:uncharacterized membrane protein YqjE